MKSCVTGDDVHVALSGGIAVSELGCASFVVCVCENLVVYSPVDGQDVQAEDVSVYVSVCVYVLFVSPVVACRRVVYCSSHTKRVHLCVCECT